jgi:hypothetical protein
MFKLALALVAVGALAADTEAPVISLDMSMTYKTQSSSSYHHSKDPKPYLTARANAASSLPIGGANAASNSKFSHFADECMMSAGTCKLPSATAYDHHDGQLKSIRIEVDKFVVGPPCTKATYPCKPTESNEATTVANSAVTTGRDKPKNSAFDEGNGAFKTRAEYVLSYDVQDDAGNKATQLKFALIVIDDVAPHGFKGINAGNFERSNHADDKLQARKFNNALRATDNVDKEALEFQSGKSGWKVAYGGKFAKNAHFPEQKCITGTKKVVKVRDFAYIFGKNYVQNVATTTLKWGVTDTNPPYLAPRVSPGVGQAKALTTTNFDYTYAFSQEVADSGFIKPANSAAGYSATLECGDMIKGYYNYPGSDVNNLFPTKFQDDGDQCLKPAPKVRVTRKNNWAGGNAWVRSSDKLLTLTFDAFDSANRATKGYTFTYKVVDTTPPVIQLDSSFMTSANRDQSKVGTGTYNGDKTEPSHTSGQSLYLGDSAKSKNLGVYGSQNIIQHSAGYERDWKQIKKWVNAFHCEDRCSRKTFDGEPGKGGDHTINTEWFKIDHDNHDCDSIGKHHKGHEEAKEAYKHQTDAFDITVVGTYVLKYTCDDAAKNTAVMCRTVYNVDHTRPVLTVVGDGPKYECTNGNKNCACASWRARSDPNSPEHLGEGTCVDSHPNDNYVDSGATCTDQVDDWISELVEVSGQVVDLNTPDTYMIKYNCKDTAGNSAIEATRTVYVIDAVCPTCWINWDCDADAKKDKWGACINTVEASFPYHDPGADCESGVLGDHKNIYSWDPAVGTFEVKCTPQAHKLTTDNKNKIDECVDVEQLGTYTLTYVYTDEAGNNNVDAIDAPGSSQTCNEFKRRAKGDKLGAGKHQYGIGYTDSTKPPQVRTVVVADRLQPIIYLQDSIIQGQMEQQSTANSWVIAAVASAIAGVALISFSSRSNAATSVPV